jgi:hypothetical protein
MRNEGNETCLIDQYLLRQLSDEDTQAFEVSLLLNAVLAQKVETQRMAHRLIRLFGRKEELCRIQGIYRQLLDEPAFARQLKTIFS